MASKQEWLNTAKATAKGNGRNICKWAFAMVESADIHPDSKSIAMIEAMDIIREGGLRGDISTRWLDCGFTREQFNYQLCL